MPTFGAKFINTINMSKLKTVSIILLFVTHDIKRKSNGTNTCTCGRSHRKSIFFKILIQSEEKHTERKESFITYFRSEALLKPWLVPLVLAEARPSHSSGPLELLTAQSSGLLCY